MRQIVPALLIILLMIACAGQPAALPSTASGQAPTATPAPVPATPTPTATGQRTLRVLFIGNSLTYTNDLPGMIAAMVGATDLPAFEYAMLVPPNFSLSDHWERGEALELIGQSGWDFVILQQGPSALPESRTLLRADAARFAEVIRAAGAEPAFYAVWPMLQRFGDFPHASESYQLAAADTAGLLIPAGEAWRAAWQRDPCLQLYAPDGLHPTPTGTYLTALVMIARLYDRPVAGLPIPSEIAREQAILLQEAATAAVGAAAPAPGPANPPRCDRG